MEVPEGVGDMTAAWLTGALGASRQASVGTVQIEPVGTGQVADTFRLRLDWDPTGAGPATVIAKVAAASQASRAAARSTRTYEVEAGFYRELAGSLAVRTPHCYFAAHAPGPDTYVVVLEDAGPARPGDQMAGCTLDEVTAALAELALLHGSRWRDPGLTRLGWLDRHGPQYPASVGALIARALPQFLARYAHRLSDDVVAVIERLGGNAPAYLDKGPWATVVHGDFRADNLLFGGERAFVVDWQTVALGPALTDVSYFLGGSLPVEQRRRHEEDLLRFYHGRLAAAGGDLSWEACWRGYRRFALDGAVMAIVASILVGQTDRGDEMFVVMAERSARHAIDLSTERLITGSG